MNNKVIAYATLAAYIAAAYVNPMWTALFTVAAFIAIPFISEVVNTLLPIDGDYLYKAPAPSMADYANAFAPLDELGDIDDDLTPAEIAAFEQQVMADIWEEANTVCELACTITSQYNYDYQLCLPAGNDIDISIEELTVEPVVVISYESYSYRELQQLVKQLRGNDKSIKLNSKKAVLVEWLQANA